ncbi:hypothetical protein WJX81_001805 [Elliptochloris bilobata]|uniref:Uncharacterized protein n=1 Tax=Elliptochloris bilobata TaxID=381761 RepID=A0AAW1RR51_9CHLO
MHPTSCVNYPVAVPGKNLAFTRWIYPEGSEALVPDCLLLRNVRGKGADVDGALQAVRGWMTALGDRELPLGDDPLVQPLLEEVLAGHGTEAQWRALRLAGARAGQGAGMGDVAVEALLGATEPVEALLRHLERWHAAPDVDAGGGAGPVLYCAALRFLRARTAGWAAAGDGGALACCWAQCAPALLTQPGASAGAVQRQHATPSSCLCWREALRRYWRRWRWTTPPPLPWTPGSCASP